MHKILVISDSHGTVGALQDVVERERPAQLLFLGDGLRDIDFLRGQYPTLPICCVRGNCDLADGVEQERLLNIRGVKIYMCLGHMLGVKAGPERLVQRAQGVGADVALYGHTHISSCLLHGGMWVMNPGSMSYYGTQRYGLIELEDGRCSCKICDYRRES